VAEDPPVPLFCNPTAGRGRAGRRTRAISELLAASGIETSIVTSRKRGDIEAGVADAIRDGHRRVLVAGGDGSIHEAVNGIMSTGEIVELGVIPVGTGNDFAKACSIPQHWEHAAALLADRMAGRAPAIPVDVGLCNGRHFANGLGIGFDARVTAIAESIRLPMGDLVYLVALLRALVEGIVTPTLRIRFGDIEIEGAVTLASFSNGPWAGGMFHIAPEAHNDDGLLDLIYAEPVGRARVLGLLPKLLRGTHTTEIEIHQFPIRKSVVVAEAPVIWHLDGEIQEPTANFEIELLAGALRLL
jgi:YegS/Rv2252/BmrU family lipid kinase